MTDSFSPKAFQRKIDAFCQLRLSPLLPAEELARLMSYMHSLIQFRHPAPRIGGRTDWSSVAAACGGDAKL
ncbi:MAG TPA: hypothetical protein VGO22_07750, partial [Pseudorhizobium sp.]|nr:hypothetical protein [Pseudorhizobium sp.]